MSPDEEMIAEMIARFIQDRGVTMCPVAVCAPTSACISPEVARFHASRDPYTWASKRVRSGLANRIRASRHGNGANRRKWS
jgi:hypothetical protein